MEYITAIRQHFIEIVGSVNNEMVVENDGETMLTALFPNYKLQTSTGKQFNVVGMIQMADAITGATQSTVLLVYEPSAAMIRDPYNCDFNDMGIVFTVDERGRIRDKNREIGLLRNFLIFKDLFHEKYHETPMFPMFLSEEQTRLLGQG